MSRAWAYATVDEYRAAKGKSSADDDLALARDLVAVSRFIDRSLGRWVGFEKDEESIARYYDPCIGTVIDVDDLVSVDTVEELIGGSYVEITDYRLRPLNAALEGEPYNRIERISGAWALPVRVTGIWGWPSVPEGIRAACIELTAIWRLETPRATNRVMEMNEITAVSGRARTIVDELVGRYLNPAVVV
jgi:hypothetical protein